MASLISPPLTVVASVIFESTSVGLTYSNPGNPYDGFPYSFTASLSVIPQLTSAYDNLGNLIQYDGRDFTAGMWIGFPGGFTFRIIAVTGANADGTTVTVEIEDKDFLNLIMNNARDGSNFPPENIPGLVFRIDDDGFPILAPVDSQSGSLSETTSYWISDIVQRFRIRNYLTNFFQITPDDSGYTGLTSGDFVYLNSSGIFVKADSTNSDEVEKVFGIVTSFDVPSTGNLNVRPLGRVVSDLPTLPGNVGDVLYFSSTGLNNLTSTKPVSGTILPVYIKIDSNTALLLSRGGVS